MIMHLFDELVRELDVDVRSEFQDKGEKVDELIDVLRKAIAYFGEEREVEIGEVVVEMGLLVRGFSQCKCSDIRMHSFASRIVTAFNKCIMGSACVAGWNLAKEMGMPDEEAQAFVDAVVRNM
jgi:hypothetical protein